MKRDFGFLAMVLCLVLAGAAGQAGQKEKVLFDTDMVEFFDDGVAMVLLANAPNIDLVGVANVSGNMWVEEGTAFAIRQLEIEGRDNIPVTQGLVAPFRPNRRELLPLERQQYGMGPDRHVGAFGREQPKSWKEFYKKQYGEDPKYDIDPRHGADFIIDVIRANPGEITIAAVGPLGNLAMAIMKDPEIVPMVKRIVYMGGSFFQQGNVMPAAEFNWWFDPEAAKIVVRAPWKEQIMVGLDVCEKVKFDINLYNKLLAMLEGSEQADLLKRTTAARFEKNPKATRFVWDVIVSAIIIDPSIITDERTAYVDVNADFGISYGQSLAYTKTQPIGTQQARIIMDIDQQKFWDMMLDKTYWNSAKK